MIFVAKTYIDTVKYLVYADAKIDGMVEKPDIVGAIFGQTEGLLGDELDLRELQKNGRIGRIDVDIEMRGGKSFGKLTLPSSLDMVETAILAAALETVNRVGPCEAKINVTKIEDTRSLKRQQVVERAKTLLKSLLTEEIPESKEISEMVREHVKVAEVETWGAERLPAGPLINASESVILVEGRADVINMLKSDIKNVIAIGGATVPRTIVELCKRKEVTAFLDGDRGGDIILRELVNACEIDFVARAPIGREVEELTRKEIIQAIRRKLPIEQVLALMGERAERREERREQPERRERYEERRHEERRQPIEVPSPSAIMARVRAEEPRAEQMPLAGAVRAEVPEAAPLPPEPVVKA